MKACVRRRLRRFPALQELGIRQFEYFDCKGSATVEHVVGIRVFAPAPGGQISSRTRGKGTQEIYLCKEFKVVARLCRTWLPA